MPAKGASVLTHTAYRFETLQVHAGQETPDPATGARAVPVYQTTSYVFNDCAQAAARFAFTEPGNVYGRVTNPTVEVFERRMAALEGGSAALGLATGAAAITYALTALADAGDKIVAASNINGTTVSLLQNTLARFGVETEFVDLYAPGALEAALDEKTKAVFIETVSNPHGTPADIEACARAAHARGIPLIVDNTFATPYLVRPIDWGADLVVHSATKFLGGHGTVMGGVLVESPVLPAAVRARCGTSFTAFVRQTLLHDTGATMAPFTAFLLLQGLETLSLRVERHTKNALAAAKLLAAHPLVACVSHPSLADSPQHAVYEKYFPHGGISVFTIDVRGGRDAAWYFIDHLKLFTLLANVADGKSLAIHPATTTHADLSPAALARQGIRENTVRLSVGTEHIDDIAADLTQALESVRRQFYDDKL